MAAHKIDVAVGVIRDVFRTAESIDYADLRKQIISASNCARSVAGKAIQVCVSLGEIKVEHVHNRSFICRRIEICSPVDDRTIVRKPAEPLEVKLPRFADPISWGIHHCLGVTV